MGTASQRANRRLANLRRRLERRRTVQDLPLLIPGAAGPYILAAPADADAVLDELSDAAMRLAARTSQATASSAPHDSKSPASDAQPAGTRRGRAPASRAPSATDDADDSEVLRMPYWAMPWASGLALAEMVLQQRHLVGGRRVLELGCGLGTTATAALEAGANLTVSDCFVETLTYCRFNALRNTGREPDTLLVDWRTARGVAALVRSGPYDLVLAADVLYEPADVAHLMALIPALTGSRGAFWLAEPGRTTSRRFVDAVSAAGWQSRVTELTRDWPVNAGFACVCVHAYSAAAP